MRDEDFWRKLERAVWKWLLLVIGIAGTVLLGCFLVFLALLFWEQRILLSLLALGMLGYILFRLGKELKRQLGAPFWLAAEGAVVLLIGLSSVGIGKLNLPF